MLEGYRGNALSILSKYGVSIGDQIIVTTELERYSGVLMPRYEFADDEHVVIKLGNGYNIGIDTKKIRDIEKIAAERARASSVVAKERRSDLPKIALISTGGTIASKIDYRTGGVRAALTAEELYNAVPELSEIANIYPQVLFSEYSENLTPKHWSIIAMKVKEISESYDGVVITHGTDTMHYSSAALSFALRDLKFPVVFVGAQRSSDRPSSDAATNLIAATLFATADVAGVFVAMHKTMSDDVISIHLGTRVRKNHTSRRDAFESIGIEPVAYVQDKTIEYNSVLRKREGRSVEVKPEFDDRVALIKYYPGMSTSIIDHLAQNCRGLILEGTGLGHVGKHLFDSIERASKNVLIGMTSQCIWGRVRMTVYETGRDLLRLGVIPLGDMIPETALVKMMWVLANSKDLEDARRLMLENLAMEYTDISSID